MTTFERINQCLLDRIGTQAQDGTQKFGFDLGLDSLDLVEFWMALEDEFDIQVADDDIEQITTVQQAVEHIDKLLAQQQER